MFKLPWFKPNEPTRPSRLWLIVDRLCNSPEHLQRIAIIVAGMFAYPLVWGLTLIVWKGFDTKLYGHQQLEILGNALIGSMILWGLVVVALVGIVRGIKAHLPGGADLELDIDNNKDPVDGTTKPDQPANGPVVKP